MNKYATNMFQVKRKTQETFGKVPWQISTSDDLFYTCGKGLGEGVVCLFLCYL
jgi:hypothetical protein